MTSIGKQCITLLQQVLVLLSLSSAVWVSRGRWEGGGALLEPLHLRQGQALPQVRPADGTSSGYEKPFQGSVGGTEALVMLGGCCVGWVVCVQGCVVLGCGVWLLDARASWAASVRGARLLCVLLYASARWKGRHSRSHASAPYRPGQEQRQGSTLTRQEQRRGSTLHATGHKGRVPLPQHNSKG